MKTKTDHRSEADNLLTKVVPVREMIAVTPEVAAKLLGINGETLWKEVALGRIRTIPMNTILRAELERYVSESSTDHSPNVQRRVAGSDEMKPTTPQETSEIIERSTLTHKGVSVREMLAFPLDVAAKLLGIGRTTLWRETSLGRIRKTAYNTIARAELERYLAEYIGTPKRNVNAQKPRRSSRPQAIAINKAD